jgi:hypothetical protein
MTNRETEEPKCGDSRRVRLGESIGPACSVAVEEVMALRKPFGRSGARLRQADGAAGPRSSNLSSVICHSRVAAQLPNGLVTFVPAGGLNS